MPALKNISVPAALVSCHACTVVTGVKTASPESAVSGSLRRLRRRAPLAGLRLLSLDATLGLLILLIAAGCASQGGEDYTRGQTRTTLTIQRGVVTDVRTVHVSEDASATGATAGGVVGGILGNLFGHGKGRVLTTLGGAAVGALGGVAAEKTIKDKEVYQIAVKLENGREIAVVQDQDLEFRPGDRVRVLTAGDGSARVQHE
ncbi:MAG: glycine zipper 2TM domain-containing protein [Deltaproteobacteria bacterium]|nr:glycine zipper 2TM domain-containing protein [Deltaproteobacteria bacterium]